jgi:membrane protease YdiL (CAAX protease family)
VSETVGLASASGHRRGILKPAFVFYGLMLVAGVIGLTYNADVDWKALLLGHRAWVGIAVGTGAGLVVVFASSLMSQFFAWTREMEKAIRQLVGRISIVTVIGLAILSSVGEEVLFRGWLQGRVLGDLGPVLSIGVTSAIFGIVHWPPQKEMAPWPFFAFVMGVVLGAEYVLTGSLAAPIMTHSVINGINLWRICGRPEKFERSSSEGAGDGE